MTVCSTYVLTSGEWPIHVYPWDVSTRWWFDPDCVTGCSSVKIHVIQIGYSYLGGKANGTLQFRKSVSRFYGSQKKKRKTCFSTGLRWRKSPYSDSRSL